MLGDDGERHDVESREPGDNFDACFTAVVTVREELERHAREVASVLRSIPPESMLATLKAQWERELAALTIAQARLESDRRALASAQEALAKEKAGFEREQAQFRAKQRAFALEQAGFEEASSSAKHTQAQTSRRPPATTTSDAGDSGPTFPVAETNCRRADDGTEREGEPKAEGVDEKETGKPSDEIAKSVEVEENVDVEVEEEKEEVQEAEEVVAAEEEDEQDDLGRREESFRTLSGSSAGQREADLLAAFLGVGSAGNQSDSEQRMQVPQEPHEPNPCQGTRRLEKSTGQHDIAATTCEMQKSCEERVAVPRRAAVAPGSAVEGVGELASSLITPAEGVRVIDNDLDSMQTARESEGVSAIFGLPGGGEEGEEEEEEEEKEGGEGKGSQARTALDEEVAYTSTRSRSSRVVSKPISRSAGLAERTTSERQVHSQTEEGSSSREARDSEKKEEDENHEKTEEKKENEKKEEGQKEEEEAAEKEAVEEQMDEVQAAQLQPTSFATEGRKSDVGCEDGEQQQLQQEWSGFWGDEDASPEKNTVSMQTTAGSSGGAVETTQATAKPAAKKPPPPDPPQGDGDGEFRMPQNLTARPAVAGRIPIKAPPTHIAPETIPAALVQEGHPLTARISRKAPPSMDRPLPWSARPFEGLPVKSPPRSVKAPPPVIGALGSAEASLPFAPPVAFKGPPPAGGSEIGGGSLHLGLGVGTGVGLGVGPGCGTTSSLPVKPPPRVKPAPSPIPGYGPTFSEAQGSLDSHRQGQPPHSSIRVKAPPPLLPASAMLPSPSPHLPGPAAKAKVKAPPPPL